MLDYIPEKMQPWRMRLELPIPSEFGWYELVEVDQAGIEQHHQVEVIDESGRALAGVWVVFGYPGAGPGLGHLTTRRNLWRGAPAELRGNAVLTLVSGYAQHTIGEGGETIFIWDLDEDNDLLLPSPMVFNCTWQRTPVGRFEHTGVRLKFQRRRLGVVSEAERLEVVEDEVARLTDELAAMQAKLDRLIG